MNTALKFCLVRAQDVETRKEIPEIEILVQKLKDNESTNSNAE